MATYSSDRRSVLKIFGSIGATCAYPFASDELHGQTMAEHQHIVTSHFLNDRDFATISRIADLIIPETDTPGAIGASVPAYIDAVISRNQDHQQVVADGLRWLDAEAARTTGSKFIDATEERQLAILNPLCAAADVDETAPAKPRNVQFFALIKNLTADGYYTSRVGLMEELRYAGNMTTPSVVGHTSVCGGF